MAQQRLALDFLPFSAANLIEQVRLLSHSETGPADQVRYLGSFLKHVDCGARTLVIERPYVDRHYLEEYLGYYATQFSPPQSRAARIHVFAGELTSESFEQRLRDSATDKREQVVASLQEIYLGFIVVRPLAAAPIGRTILQSYRSSRDRVYGPYAAPHVVHLAGVELRVTGTPFQQQDQGAGACATAALWSSLARVIRADGGRAPTPVSVTLAATKHSHEGRVFPAEAGFDPGGLKVIHLAV